MKFRKKPVIIEAEQWNEFGTTSFDFRDAIITAHKKEDGTIHRDEQHIVEFNGYSKMSSKMVLVSKPIKAIKTLGGWHEVVFGDWIIRGIKGEFYPCKPDIFEATYEKVD